MEITSEESGLVLLTSLNIYPLRNKLKVFDDAFLELV